MLYKIDEENIWPIILFITGAFGVFVAGVIILVDIFKVKFPKKKEKKIIKSKNENSENTFDRPI